MKTNISKNLHINIQHLKENFKDCGDFVERKIPIRSENALKSLIYVVYIDALIDRKALEISVISPIITRINNIGCDSLFETIKDVGVSTAEVKDETDFDKILTSVLSGDCAIFVDGFDKAMIISAKGFPSRGVQKAETEVVVQGSQEAFSEGMRTNTGLIRRRIRDTKLKVVQTQMGRRSATDVAVMYLEGIARPKIVEETLKRLAETDIDAVLDSGYVEQLIEDNWLSPFPQTQMTERPDKAAASILEGRVVIVVDNSPFVLIVPATLACFYQSSEDYYQRFHIMSFARVLRYAAGFLAIALPGLYIALTVFHPSMIPMLLAFKMAAAHELVPFPTVFEVLMMELAFELLREAGIRLPGAVGSSIGIIGGLIIGQAAVEAGIVSPSVVIVVALTGIASFAIPQYSLVAAFRIMKYLIIIMSAFFGLFGFWAAMIVITVHLAGLKSFGIPYLFPFSAGGMNRNTDYKDTVVRAPLFMMKKRPFFSDPSNRKRQP